MVIFDIPPRGHTVNPQSCPDFALNPESRASNKGNPGSRNTFWGPSQPRRARKGQEEKTVFD